MSRKSQAMMNTHIREGIITKHVRQSASPIGSVRLADGNSFRHWK
jgi:hypothetical protein